VLSSHNDEAVSGVHAIALDDNTNKVFTCSFDKSISEWFASGGIIARPQKILPTKKEPALSHTMAARSKTISGNSY
jgi:hypothetical protein